MRNRSFLKRDVVWSVRESVSGPMFLALGHEHWHGWLSTLERPRAPEPKAADKNRLGLLEPKKTSRTLAR
jgi:hypothetical protein